MTNFTFRHWGFFFAAASAAILAAVYVSQYGFGMHPCHLCLLERIPYFVALLLALFLVTFHGNRKLARWLIILLAVTFAASTALAVFHTGVEYKWWTYNSGCSGTMFKKGASAEEILAALKAAPTVRCDDRVDFLFGYTMAFYNALTSGGLTLLAVYAAIRTSRSALRG
ncbi:MAG: disulfide bond formation protein [Alphaproteobacteria bacterium]|nr:disulfide bond formation protein [Alphaproteobacteria bacterium]